MIRLVLLLSFLMLFVLVNTLEPCLSPLQGELVLTTCKFPACSTLTFATFNLSTRAVVPIYDFPFDAFEDGFVADNVGVINTTLRDLPPVR